MKKMATLFGVAAGLSIGSMAQAAFVVGASGTPTANFGFGGDTTSASTSTASSAAVGAPAGSIFGGDGSNASGAPFDPAIADTYVFSYTPGSDADNFSPAAGALLGSTTGFGTELASGVAGGGSGLYNVYFTTPSSTNVNQAGSNFILTQNGTDITISAVNLNDGGTGADLDAGPAFVGGANNAWYKLGTVDLIAGNTYTVTMQALSNSFVSQRASAVMWEAVPEPATASLLALGGLAMLRRRSA